MMRALGAGGGFEGRVARVASARLTHAVAVALAIGAFSLCLTVAFTVMSIRVAMAKFYPDQDLAVESSGSGTGPRAALYRSR